MPRPMKPLIGDGFRFDLARAIRTKRLRLKLTIQQAADRAGMSRSMWNYHERGTEPTISSFAAICKALKVHNKPWSQLLAAFGVQEKWGKDMPSAQPDQQCGGVDDE